MMDPKSPKLLNGARKRCDAALAATARRGLDDYQSDDLLHSAVERHFEVIGGALLRLERLDPTTAGRISDYRKIIGFRNRLAHGYDDIDYGQTWEIIHQYLPVLKSDIEHLLYEWEEHDPEQPE